VGPTQPPIQWVPVSGSSTGRVKWHTKLIIHLVLRLRTFGTVQGDSGGKINILGGD